MSGSRWRLATLAVLVLAACSMAGAAQELQVQVRQAPVRQRAEALAPVVGTLHYADRVRVEEKLGTGWLRITGLDKAITGWLRASAVAKSVQELRGGGTGGVSGEEVSLAGKGLRESVDQYIKEHDLAAAAAKLDTIESASYTDLSLDELAAFQSAGGLTPAEGK